MSQSGAGDAVRPMHLTPQDRIRDLINQPQLKAFAGLLLPREDNTRVYDTPLSEVGTLMPYHGHVVPAVIVAALNRLRG